LAGAGAAADGELTDGDDDEADAGDDVEDTVMFSAPVLTTTG